MAEDFSAEFIAQLKQDQPLAWRLAFQALYPIAWHGAGHARWRLSEQDREEVASEALAEIARQLAGLATWREISALTFVIARRRSISRLRALLAQKRGARGHATVSLEEIGEIELATENLSQAANGPELAEAVAALVQRLGEPAATLVREHVHEGATHEELARRHGKPIGTIGVILYRAMHQLRREVGRTPKFMKELQLYLRLLVVA
jgi:DNA-directed RNA polymerase specialized sigma24 family protein